ncbi:carboxymuconolactone decarboxylase family protein [Flexivirga sp. ID2601S]|uniref:Carboxymuconolactone decarboxylase family protein n=1 Tax=Flexivirga aerilata TaxID=1656889 RepID=A0A849ACP4_9MICO|nr:carboxymuconolactone decarboxylase family protein [Flexivirga aerilata]NNG38295.1 carboxymuconolactone decarboxylase family protein [Flexivirga aerilata]
MRPYLDKAAPDVWRAARAYSASVLTEATARGLEPVETELIKLRASQLNGCAFCLDLHAREARAAGIPQQRLDLLPAWRETAIFTERERAVLAIAEAATQLPLSEESRADLAGALAVLGDEVFVAAEWVAVTINTFNRVSILSEHAVQPRGADGRLAR